MLFRSKDMIYNNPFTIVGRMSAVWGSDLDASTKIKRSLSNAIEAFTWGSIHKEDVEKGINTVLEVGGNIVDRVKPIINNIFQNNPITGIPYQMFTAIRETGFSDISALLKNVAGGALQALTFGAVKRDQVVSGIEAMPDIISGVVESAKNIATNIFQNNPITGIPYQAFSAIKEKGFSDIPDTILHVLGGTLQALTFGAVNKESIVSAVPKMAKVVSNVFDPVINVVKNLAKWNPLRAVGNVADRKSVV